MFFELKDADICGLGREEDKHPEGRAKPSWIWNIPLPSLSLNTSHPSASSSKPNLSSCAASGEEVAISIQAHWARCQARAERHKEEVQLTLEEMCWTLEFFKWKSCWWLTLSNLRAELATPPDPQIQHGLRAYADRQALVYSSLVITYVNYWRKFLVKHLLGVDWLNLYPITSPLAKEPTLVEGTDAALEGDNEDKLDSEDPTDQEFEERFAGLHDT